MNKHQSIFGAVIAALLAVGSPTGVCAQEGVAEEIDEITVTGRKREESLKDVPVAISAFSQADLVEQGITNLQKLYEATPGLTFDTAHGDRNSSQPAVRGVQSTRVLSTLQKVTSFVDGIPMAGQVASLTFAGIDQVEVYRGPQSAAFGRATFAGAINYSTADAPEQFEGKIQGRMSSLYDNELGISISGPLGDKLGYRLTYIADEFTGPDEWTANNGAKLGTEDTKTVIAKLNFEFSDRVDGELIYMWVEQDDTYGPFNRLDPAADCSYEGDSGLFVRTGGRFLELPSGAWDCDVYGTPLRRNHDAIGQFTAAYDDHIDEYTAAAPGADTNGDGIVSLEEYLAQTTPAFGTFEQALLGQTMEPRVVNKRQRIQGTLNFEIGDGHLLQILGMTNEEDFNRWFDADRSDAHPVFFMNNIYMAGLLTMLAGTTSQPSTEDYAEVRWVSPSDNRFRYMLSAAYYAYDYRIEVFSNWGAREYGLTHPDGSEISALRNIVIGQGMTNVGAAFGLQYDWTDRTTFSFEGRWQNDENCGEDAVVEGKLCQEADSFAPRLAFNTAINDNHNIYGQIAQGTNPGGVNLAYIDPNIVDSLAVARGDIPVPDVPGAVNAGVLYNGQDGNPPPAVDYMADDWKYYEEEELTNFEIGAKGRFGNGRGTYEVALFYMDWDNVLDRRILDWNDDTEGGWNEGYWNDYVEAHTYLNEGDAVIKGLEFSSRYHITDIWSVEGNLTLLDATYDNYCAPQATEYFTSNTPPLETVLPILTREEDGVLVACGVVDGNKLPRIADISGMLRVAADLPNEIWGFHPRFDARVLYEGSHYDDPLNLIKRNSVTTLNLAAIFVHPKLTLRFFINNVTDEQEPRSLGWGTFLTDNANPTIRPSQAASWSVLPRRPREYGLTLIYRFGNN